jgi:hypothetical protein
VSLRFGLLLAALVAGPPLWGLVQAGQLESGTALTRALLVAAACAVGVALVGRIARGYQAQATATAAARPPDAAQTATPAIPSPPAHPSDG